MNEIQENLLKTARNLLKISAKDMAKELEIDLTELKKLEKKSLSQNEKDENLLKIKKYLEKNGAVFVNNIDIYGIIIKKNKESIFYN